MAVNVYAGLQDPIKLVLTTGKEKTPISALALSRVVLDLLDRENEIVLHTIDSLVDVNVFFTNRTEQTIKGVSVFLLEMELHGLGLTVQEDLIARLTVYDSNNPGGLPWKQFALNSR
jgi:hypothetical protein